MGMSVGILYSTANGSYEIYSERRADELVARLRKADLVVGYNILSFDYEVLMAYTILDLPHYLPTLDLLHHIERAAGHWYQLGGTGAGHARSGGICPRDLTPSVGGGKGG